MDFSVTCSRCGEKVHGYYNSSSTFTCQHCGKDSGILSFSDKRIDNTVTFQCTKCNDEFIIKAGVESLLKCPKRTCGWSIIKPLTGLALSKIIENLESDQEDFVYTPLSNPLPISSSSLFKKTSLSLRLAIPYYNGGKRIERAIRTWIYPEIVFFLTDQGIIPPGYQICNQIFTPKNSASEGVGKFTKPFIIDILSKMLEYFPNEEYYGFVNSDIILPIGTSLKSLLPRPGKNIVFHHRIEFDGKDDSPIRELKEKFQIYCGKDMFIGERSVIKKIVDSVKDMIVGGAAWDDGLVVWCFKNTGEDKVDLRYGEIHHAIHSQNWTTEDRESVFNRRQLGKSGIPEYIRLSYNWFKVMNEELDEDKKKRIKPLGLIQPGRIGDIIICLPIAKWYFDRGHKIVWPVISEFMPLFDYINYVEPIDIGSRFGGSYKKAKDILEERNITEIIDLGIGFGRDESDWVKTGLSFDEWKYYQAKVPFEERFNLQINRNYQKELDLQDKLNLIDKEDYVVTHSVGTKGKVRFGQLGSVEIQPISGYTVFDWIGIIERASKVYCVDSCMAHLVNQLSLAKGRRIFRPLDDYFNRPGPIPKIQWKEEPKTDRKDFSNVPKTKTDMSLPIHFFTIVQNGMPFIKYHLQLFNSLPFDWHWHISEGVADLKYDTQWTIANGGKIDDSFHINGLSIDGTTEYLNNIKKLFPDRISIYRKGEGKFWDGKVDMCNAPIPNLPEQCILWQVDVDELWSLMGISQLKELFDKNPDKMAAYVYCYYFVGPKKFVSSINSWATLSQDWFRVFRYFKGFHWKRHEPPTLVDDKGVDWGRTKNFSRDETLGRGISFQHFAYVIPNQLSFKESYYGYKDATKFWENLQKTKGEVDVGDYLPWATKGAKVKDWDEREYGELLYPGTWMY